MNQKYEFSRVFTLYCKGLCVDSEYENVESKVIKESGNPVLPIRNLHL